MRGGGTNGDSSVDQSEGRSPHARGRQLYVIKEGGIVGSIPACAGEALQRLLVRGFRRVDPRMRGGGSIGYANELMRQGRSPHARGRLSIIKVSGLNMGVDPRMRGGGIEQHSPSPSHRGRSPHARGRRGLCFFKAVIIRSIPACAGEASTSRPSSPPHKVDPRMRGGG